MSDQLELVPATPTLTPRQAEALAHLRAAGTDGLTGHELGRAMGVHEAYAKTNGLQWARALKKRGLCELKKGGIWRAVNTPDNNSLPPGMTDVIPF